MDTTGGGAGTEYAPDQAAPGVMPGTDESGPAASGGARIGDGVAAVFLSARQALADFFALISLEVHRAGVSFMWMMAWSTFAVLLIATAWIALMAGLALWLVSLGVAAAPAIICIAAANLFGGAAILYCCVNLSHDLLLPATRRQLRITAADAGSS